MRSLARRSQADEMARATEQLVAVNAIAFLAIYAIVHWLTDDQFNERYEILVVVFGVLRAIVGIQVVLPEKEAQLRAQQRKRRTPAGLSRRRR